MIINEKDEMNLILSFEKDIKKPNTSKEKISQEISIFLSKKYISEQNALALQNMISMNYGMNPDNENFIQYNNCKKKLIAN
jgi:hypothetical protein